MGTFLKGLLCVGTLISTSCWIRDEVFPGPTDSIVSFAVKEMYGPEAEFEVLGKRKVSLWLDAASTLAKDYWVMIDVDLKVTINGVPQRMTFMFVKLRSSGRWGYTPFDRGGMRLVK